METKDQSISPMKLTRHIIPITYAQLAGRRAGKKIPAHYPTVKKTHGFCALFETCLSKIPTSYRWLSQVITSHQWDKILA